jgi:hypothetical protein
MDKFARLDTATGRGMNEGYCLNDGEAYFEEQSDLIAYIRNEWSVPADKLLSDAALLEHYYFNESYYYTEWDADDEDTYYIEVEGKWLEVLQG